jgi:WhiB family redox-sensing transcriptional regulator
MLNLDYPPFAGLSGMACKDEDPETFYPVSNRSFATIARARAFCQSCPFQDECREWAVEKGERFGIWGGTTPKDRGF